MNIFFVAFSLCWTFCASNEENVELPPCTRNIPANSSKSAVPFGWSCYNETGRKICYPKNYYYNREKDTCEQFEFEGCKANKNNFVSLDDCMAYCKRATPAKFPVSSDLQRTNPGLYSWLQKLPNCTEMTLNPNRTKRILRFFYNSTSKTCRPVLVEDGDAYFPGMNYCVQKCNATNPVRPRCNRPMEKGTPPKGWSCKKEKFSRVCKETR